MGFYDRVPQMQERFRQRLFTEGGLWLSLLGAPAMAPFELEAQGPKRMKPVDLADELKPWYYYRKFSFDASGPIDSRVFSAELKDVVEERFLALEPVYRFVQGWDVDESR